MPNRRHFLKMGAGTTALALSAASYGRIKGANERVNVGVMGPRSRGQGVMKAFLSTGNCNISHICDVDRRVNGEVSSKLKAAGQPQPKQYEDVRKMLEDPSLDAIVIATPDHWHTPAAIMALQAGKHVYVEKPCSHNPAEGEMLVKATEKYQRVVQMGNQQRSSNETLELIQRIRQGELGDVYKAYTWYANNRKSIGNGKKTAAPDWLNWDLWQGPAPRQDYFDNYVHYNWHWFWQWGTAETCNNGAHELDIARWAMGLDYAERVATNGSRRFFKDDDWQMYDTMVADFHFADNKTITWEGHSCNQVKKFGRGRGTLLYGTKGFAIVDREGYELYDTNEQLIASNIVDGKKASTADLVGGGMLTNNHANNFLNTVKNKSHNFSPIDEGHKSTLLCQLANISYRSGQELHCDASNGHIKDPRAMELWGREYQPGWDVKI